MVLGEAPVLDMAVISAAWVTLISQHFFVLFVVKILI